MSGDWAVPGSDKWDQLYESDEEEPDADAPDESTVRGDGPLALEPEPEPAADAALAGPPPDPITLQKQRLHSMLRSSCEWWDRTATSPSAREEWFTVKGQWSKPNPDGSQSLDVLGVPMEIRNKQLRQEQEQKDGSMAIELSNQDAMDEVALMRQMAQDANYAREVGGEGRAEEPLEPELTERERREQRDLLRRHGSGGGGQLLQPGGDPWGGTSASAGGTGHALPPPTAPHAQMVVVEVAVPASAQPGARLQVEIPDGRTMEVELPAHATPGELLRVQVPAMPPPVGMGGGLGMYPPDVPPPQPSQHGSEDEMDGALAQALAESLAQQEQESPGGSSPGLARQARAPPPVDLVAADERLVGELVMMGIEQAAAERAAVAVGNASVEAAMEHIFAGPAAAEPAADDDDDEPPEADDPLSSFAAPGAAAADQVVIPFATSIDGGGAGAWAAPIGSAPPPAAAVAEVCPRCEEMESTCGICLAAQEVGPLMPAVAPPVDPELESRIGMVCGMGFSRDAAENALAVSGQNVEEAIDLLLSQGA